MVRDDRASIVFVGAIRDAHGVERRELFEGEAQWRLTLHRLAARETVPSRDGSILGAAQVREIPVYVPVYEVVQRLGDGRAVMLQVPVESVRAVRMPLEEVEVHDATGAVVERQLVAPAVAAQRRERRSARSEGG